MSVILNYRNEEELFKRYDGNPILTPAGWPYRVNAVFNPAAATCNGETILLVRVEDREGFSHFTVARSQDGKTVWRIETSPTLQPDPTMPEEQWGIEDPRAVWVDELKEYAITYVSLSRNGPTVSLMTTKDFTQFQRFGTLLPPEDKDASLFPKKFSGRFGLIHRPIVRGEAHIWISFSPDLKYWGDHKVVLHTRPGRWDAHAVGLGVQPIETSEGWLIIYHGVRATASGKIYRVGLALLDLEEPWKVIRRSKEWVFGPYSLYECTGDVDHVAFPCGAVVDEKTGELRVYYGAADTTVALATGSMKEIMEYLRNCPSEK